MQYEGEFDLPGKKEEVLKLLLDASRLPQCIPNVVSYKAESMDKASITFRVDVGGAGIEYLSRMTSRLDVTIRREQGDTVVYEGKGKIAGAGYTVVISLSPQEKAGHTSIKWRANVELGKTLALLGSFFDTDKMVEQIAKDTINKLRECVEKSFSISSS
jgi:carbon monoxide dehydrogenase subunit G|uniref:Carbon monoxide dehydrogenase n=1 Tax=Fervidicoccus fontis TaxID=683846 RepID=A0A7C1IE22_9CREN